MAKYSYQIVPDYFIHWKQGRVETPEEIGPVPPRFGLLEESESRWSFFSSNIQKLNAEASPNTTYKVIFFGRHGEGFHNVGEAKYGTEAWDDYWALRDGDGEIVWGPDPELTELGKHQASLVHDEWVKELQAGMILPQKLYSSPMSRAIETNQITFQGLLPEDRKTLIVENCREQFADHTCDKRRTHSFISATFPDYVIEDGFTEEDSLYTGTKETGETTAHVVARAGAVLDRIFSEDNEAFISITAHGGVINGFLVALGSVPYPLPTGGKLIECIRMFHTDYYTGVIPVVIKATLIG